MKTTSAQKKARETLDVYAPLANRLGMNAIKTELEELSFKVLYPKIYNEIVVLVARRAGQRDVYLKQILAEINEDLDEQNIKAYVTGRPKDYFSIYQKMIVRGHDFANIYDLVGVRIIVDTIQDCYAALGAVHARWNPVPGRFKDYIAMPKLNMYQSLHTTVVGPGGKPVEIQIRTWDMHRRAEFAARGLKRLQTLAARRVDGRVRHIGDIAPAVLEHLARRLVAGAEIIDIHAVARDALRLAVHADDRDAAAADAVEIRGVSALRPLDRRDKQRGDLIREQVVDQAAFALGACIRIAQQQPVIVLLCDLIRRVEKLAEKGGEDLRHDHADDPRAGF